MPLLPHWKWSQQPLTHSLLALSVGLFMQTTFIWNHLKSQWWEQQQAIYWATQNWAGSQQHHSAEKKTQRGSRNVSRERMKRLLYGCAGSDRMQDGRGLSCCFVHLNQERKVAFLKVRRAGSRTHRRALTTVSEWQEVYHLLQHMSAHPWYWAMICGGPNWWWVTNSRYIVSLQPTQCLFHLWGNM